MAMSFPASRTRSTTIGWPLVSSVRSFHPLVSKINLSGIWNSIFLILILIFLLVKGLRYNLFVRERCEPEGGLTWRPAGGGDGGGDAGGTGDCHASPLRVRRRDAVERE